MLLILLWREMIMIIWYFVKYWTSKMLGKMFRISLIDEIYFTLYNQRFWLFGASVALIVFQTRCKAMCIHNGIIMFK